MRLPEALLRRRRRSLQLTRRAGADPGSVMLTADSSWRGNVIYFMDVTCVQGREVVKLLLVSKRKL